TAGVTFTGIDFAPGAVMFNGQPVDFDGKEPQWLASAHAGTLHIPATSGPATVTLHIDLNNTGFFTGPWSIDLPSVNLGPAFAPIFCDIVPGPTNMSSIAPSWNSAQVPQLNGANVYLRGPQNLQNVNPNAGQFQLVTAGANQIDAVAVPEPSTLLLTLTAALV